MSELNAPKYVRQELVKERAHRREKVWKIFSWAATLLVAIIGGVFALKTNPPENFEFSLWLEVILAASVLILTAYACWWIKQNQDIQRHTQAEINKCDEELSIPKVIPDGPPKFGYKPALVMLAIAAIIAVFIQG